MTNIFTDEERIKMLKSTKVMIKSSHVYYTYICTILQLLISRKRPNRHYSALSIFPELLKYKPKDNDMHAPWWPYNDKKIRLEVIDNVITDIKALNDKRAS